MTMTNQQLLDSARKAHHDLITGSKPLVVVDQNGQRVEFGKVQIPQLLSYIRQLETLCGCNAVPVVSGPLGFIF